MILTEKPNVAAKIAAVLSKGKAKRKEEGPLSYYSFEQELKFPGSNPAHAEIVVIPASGHLLGVDFPDEYNRNWTYPVIVPAEKLPLVPIDNRTRGFLKVIEKVAKDANILISACDLDTEGSAIAYEIIKYLGLHRGKNLFRMEYSSLTAQEINSSFENLKPFDEGRSLAGYTRGAQDFLWGANVTRALTIAARRAGQLQKGAVLSAGRVQSPTLAIIVNREREIEDFKPVIFYTITGTFQSKESVFTAEYSSIERIESEELAKAIVAELESGGDFLLNVEKNMVSTRPPPPFNGTDLQVEGARVLKLTPAEIADRRKGIAQHLYEAGLISYPGTDSQKYPATFTKSNFLNMVEIPKMLKEEIEWVKANLRYPPAEGKKEDAAHPCIHITGFGDFPDEKHRKLYELIARRNLATLSPDSKEEKTDVLVRGEEYSNSLKEIIKKCPEEQIDKVKSFRHEFTAKGKRIVEHGWRRIYPYIKVEEKEMPPLENGSKAKAVSFKITKKMTQPPPRFSETSLIAELDKVGIGTKNTRHAIIEKLRSREYIEGKKVIMPTLLGRRVVDVLSRHAERIVDVDFTAHLEEKMEEIIKKPEIFLPFNAEMVKELEAVLLKYKAEELEIGKEILKPETDEERQKRENARRARAKKEKEIEEGKDDEKDYKEAVEVPTDTKSGKSATKTLTGAGRSSASSTRDTGKMSSTKKKEDIPAARKEIADSNYNNIYRKDAQQSPSGARHPPSTHAAKDKSAEDKKEENAPRCPLCKSAMKQQTGQTERNHNNKENKGSGENIKDSKEETGKNEKEKEKEEVSGVVYKCSDKGCAFELSVHGGESISDGVCECGYPIIEGNVKTKSGYTLQYRRCHRNCDKSPLICAKCGKRPKVLSGPYGKYIKCECGAVNYFRRK
ncbi:MAG: type IA DNA topoisomerase [Thermoplasmata archaeon]